MDDVEQVGGDGVEEPGHGPAGRSGRG
jgi:hypothetical protein